MNSRRFIHASSSMWRHPGVLSIRRYSAAKATIRGQNQSLISG
ncbi:hypothetical protein ACPOL_0916 [Acidisarcina polymorpha]|uniref:Uncharacterized protein n=1 Tax=Acidisarcina polymorpha TaxID=2211140 RepID=A0A2Z5FTV8_9BACT|nr:hypothetical protein ACPOL_0916 [Acidisarcina polymorpha]